MTKVLVADPDRVFVEVLKTYLRRTGIFVLSGRTASEAINLVCEENAELLFVSTNLDRPLKLLQEMRDDEKLAAIPVILISTSAALESSLYAEQLWSELILKPVDRSTFLGTINRFLDTEKRLSSRLKIEIPVTWSINSESGRSGITADISAGGLFLQTVNTFPAGTEITVCFTIPRTGTEIGSTARVAWENPPHSPVKPHLAPGMGLQFVELDPAHELAIKSYLREEVASAAKALKEKDRREGIDINALTSRLGQGVPMKR